MKKLFLWPVFGLLAIALIGASATISFASDESTRVDKAGRTLQSAVSSKEIPPSVLKDAYGVAIIPEYWKAALLGGWEHGNGVLMVQQGPDKWSDPSFISVSGGSLGAQVGFESSDMILVFRNKDAVNKLLAGRFELGADATVAAGPAGAKAQGTTIHEDVLAYVRTQGGFIGASVSGTVISVDEDGNSAFYGMKNVTPQMIFAGQVKAPKAAQDLRATLEKLTATA